MISSPVRIAMGAALRYWRLVRIDATGKRRIKEIPEAQEFFLLSFPEFMAQSDVPDTLIQRQLLHWMKQANQGSLQATSRQEEQQGFLAQRCLQCFISHQIERVCLKLEAQFGADHGFTCNDLLPFVLDDDGIRQQRNPTRSVATPYQSLISDILQTFEPEQSSLATWATRRVKHHKELNAFLLEHGVYLVSDWAILNDTRPKQLQRIFTQFHGLTPVEVQQATRLLENYHAVYRAQRLLARQTGTQGQCLPPTTEQLQQMAQRLFNQTHEMLAPEILMTQLQEIGSRLREYRIYVRGGSLPTESLDAKVNDTNTLSERLPALEGDNQDTDEQTEFLSFYRQQLVECLDQAVAQVTDDQVRKLKRKDPDKAEKFLAALQLFHCQELSMSEIAPLVNLQAQFQVSRLLKLKSLRADIRQRLLLQLRDRIFEQAKVYTTPERLQTLNQQLEEVLSEQIDTVIQEALTEASTATTARKQTLPSSLFAQRLCRYLDSRRN
jgi:hypothetical protein